jgi:hypothetical protein
VVYRALLEWRGKAKPCPYSEHPEKSAFFVFVETTWIFYHFQETKPVR